MKTERRRTSLVESLVFGEKLVKVIKSKRIEKKGWG